VTSPRPALPLPWSQAFSGQLTRNALLRNPAMGDMSQYVTLHIISTVVTYTVICTVTFNLLNSYDLTVSSYLRS
jgi:uncharacterized membrane protein YesL